jgi:predicted nucleic acid-binding protein
MKKLVIDSSVIVKWLNQQNELHLIQADKILNDVRENRVMLLAPELAKYEIGNALLIRKQLSANGADVTFNNLFALPIQFVSQSEELANETYVIAKKANITYYDACFIALAKQESAELVTDNPKHQAKTKVVSVKPLEDY